MKLTTKIWLWLSLLMSVILIVDLGIAYPSG
jgi:hypothetical protein